MNTIEVDFEVFKQLTLRRATEEVSYNDVVRELLGLENPNINSIHSPTKTSSDDWIVKGVQFPAGTEFRANYKGKIYVGRVEGGKLIVDGKRYDAPSAAAVAITKNAANGWRFWECRMPGKSSWQLIESLRK